MTDPRRLSRRSQIRDAVLAVIHEFAAYGEPTPLVQIAGASEFLRNATAHEIQIALDDLTRTEDIWEGTQGWELRVPQPEADMRGWRDEFAPELLDQAEGDIEEDEQWPI